MDKYNFPTRFLCRADGVVTTDNILKVPWHWESLFQHLKITELTVLPISNNTPHLIVYKKLSKKIMCKQVDSIKKYFYNKFFIPDLSKFDDFEEIINKSVDVPIINKNLFVIPREILRMVGIRRRIVFIGMLTHFEIWSRSYYIDEADKISKEFKEFSQSTTQLLDD